MHQVKQIAVTRLRIALGADERTGLVDYVVKELEKRRGYVVHAVVPDPGKTLPWAEVGEAVAREVVTGDVSSGILFCWTGTGVCMVANKVPGVRAALCGDAQTAAGARQWNNANLLVLSLRSTSEGVAQEILDAWFSTSPEGGEAAKQVERLNEIDGQYRRKLSLEPAPKSGGK